MKIIIVGGGVIGCAVARELSRYKVDVTLLESHNDVACGASKANSGIAHAGYDATSGSLKAMFNVGGNAMFDKLSQDLNFSFKRNGSMVLCMDNDNMPQLEVLRSRGIANGVEGLQILNHEQVLALNHNISDKVVGALYAPSAGIVDPYGMTIAYAENAFANGVQFLFNKKVIDIVVNHNNGQGQPMSIFCDDGSSYGCDIVVNCAGVYADEINNMVGNTPLKITPRRGEYWLMDVSEGHLVEQTLFQLPTKLGKGALITHSCHGNLLVGPNAVDIDDKDDVDTTYEGLADIFKKGQTIIPTLNKKAAIRQFSGIRAKGDGDDFVIGFDKCDRLFNVAAIDSPGLTSAPSIGCYVATELADKFKLSSNCNFNPYRQGIPCFATMSNVERESMIQDNPLYAKVICRCECVTEGEIVAAIRRPLGAVDLDGVKKRVRAGMGRCQSGFCMDKIMQILARERGVAIDEITLKGKGSEIIVGGIKQ